MSLIFCGLGNLRQWIDPYTDMIGYAVVTRSEV
jgi:hypothetical protein